MHLTYCTQLADVGALENAHELHLVSCPLVTDFSRLARVHTLLLDDMKIAQLFAAENVNLTLSNCPLLTDISRLSSVGDLRLDRCRNVACLRALANVTRRLAVYEHPATDLPPLRVRSVSLESCDIVDVSPLCGVEHVDLCRCKRVADISPLRAARCVCLSVCPLVRDIAPISHVRALHLYGMDCDLSSLGAQYSLYISRVSLRQGLPVDCARLGNCYRLTIVNATPTDAPEKTGCATARVRHCQIN